MPILIHVIRDTNRDYYFIERTKILTSLYYLLQKAEDYFYSQTTKQVYRISFIEEVSYHQIVEHLNYTWPTLFAVRAEKLDCKFFGILSL